MDGTAGEVVTDTSTSLSEVERQLENQLRHYNTQLTSLNERLALLQSRKESLQLRMGRVARQLYDIRAKKIKQAYVDGKRV